MIRGHLVSSSRSATAGLSERRTALTISGEKQLKAVTETVVVVVAVAAVAEAASEEFDCTFTFEKQRRPPGQGVASPGSNFYDGEDT